LSAAVTPTLLPDVALASHPMYAKVFSGEAEVNTPGTVLIDVGTFHVPYQPERISIGPATPRTSLHNIHTSNKISGEAENIFKLERYSMIFARTFHVA